MLGRPKREMTPIKHDSNLGADSQFPQKVIEAHREKTTLHNRTASALCATTHPDFIGVVRVVHGLADVAVACRPRRHEQLKNERTSVLSLNSASKDSQHLHGEFWVQRR